MLSPMERKKIGFPLLASSTAELKKYVDVYSLFVESGYTRELCDAYSDAFIDNAKKPAPFDILQLASFYDKIMDHKTAAFYLDKLTDKKLSGEERFDYCTGMLRTISKIGNWREAADFRTANITKVDTWEEFEAALEKGGFVSAHWDGTTETEVAIKEKTKATIRCIPLGNPLEEGKCILTGKPSKQRVLFAIAY